MPTYSYKCHACRHEHEEFRPITKDGPKVCPKCGEAKKFGIDFTKSRVTGLVYGNPTTVGQQAEINARRVGKESMQLMQTEQANRESTYTGPLPKGAKLNRTGTGETPPWRDGTLGNTPMDKPLDVSKVTNLKKYVETGVAS